MLIDSDYRARITRRAKSPTAITYWQTIFPRYGRQEQEVVGPLQNKLDPLIGNDRLRAIIGQTTSSFHLPRIMREGRILIARLAKGEIGDEPAHLLGALLTTATANAALARASLPQSARRHFHLVADEFHAFASKGFDIILSELRKYGCVLTIANQFLGQLDEHSTTLREAVFGNVGSIVAFRTGADDAQVLAREMRVGLVESTTQQFLADPGQYQLESDRMAIARLHTKGRPGDACHIDIPPPPAAVNPRPQRAIAHSRARFGRERAKVEDAIARFLSPPAT
jgi:hypothetical protein